MTPDLSYLNISPSVIHYNPSYNVLYEHEVSKNEGIVTANIYGSGQNVIDYDTDLCFPYLLTIELSDAFSSEYGAKMALDKSSKFPSCDFWNTDDSIWDTAGCFVHDITNDSVICACTHLTTFRASSDKVIPEANTITKVEHNEVTFSNLLKHPVVWITNLCLFVLFVIICCINPRDSDVHSRSILSVEDR